MQRLEDFLTVAAGRITCLRCTAHSSRTGAQCGRPALRFSTSQKCQFHGGRGSGPKTEEGKARIARAQFVHGRDTRTARAERSLASARLSRLENAAYLLGMMQGPRTSGRKARDYVKAESVQDAKQMILDDPQARSEATNMLFARPIVR